VQGGERRGETIAWYATLALPAASVLAVGYAVLVLGKPRPVFAARIRGGPTEGVMALSFRFEAVRHSRDEEAPLANDRVALTATLANGEKLEWEGTLNDEGAADVTLRTHAKVTAPVRVRATLPPGKYGADRGTPRAIVLVDDRISLTAEEWSRGARHRGGWTAVGTNGPLAVRVAPGRGAFAVPFKDPLVVEVHKGGVALAGASVRIVAEGADPEPSEIVTNAEGRGRVMLSPREHAVSVSVHARAPTGEEAEVDAVIAVVPGALHASVSGARLVVRSPVALDRAYVTVVGERARISGGEVALKPNEAGESEGVFSSSRGGMDEWTRSAHVPSWAVVSSEPDQHSASLVGWPLVTRTDEPTSTFDVADVLLADGIGAAVERENERVGRIQVSAAAAAVAVLSLTGALLVRRGRRAARALEAHFQDNLDPESTRALVDSKGGRTWTGVALVCIAIGAALIAVFAMLR
jgi:hypothetical protein